jgi:hypothetical protein
VALENGLETTIHRNDEADTNVELGAIPRVPEQTLFSVMVQHGAGKHFIIFTFHQSVNLTVSYSVSSLVCQSVRLSACQPISLSACLPVCQSASLSVCESVKNLALHRSLNPWVQQFAYLFVYP